jgi:branched-subunit amino acid transport protein
MNATFDPYVWGGILVITLATMVARAGLLLLPGRLTWPPSVDAALRYAPACALAGIIAPDLLYTPSTNAIDWLNPRFLAGIAGVIIFATSRSMIGTITGGMAVFIALRVALG